MITLGTDPEIVTILTDPNAARGFETLIGKPMPAYFSLGVVDHNAPDIVIPFGTLRPDGMAAEFTVIPSDSVAVMVEHLRANIHATADIALAHGCILSVEPDFHTDPLWIDTLPESYGKACSLQVLGCDPDWSVYQTDPPKRPNPKTYYRRTTGGHIHLELGGAIINDNVATAYTAALLDLIIGTAATYLCTSQQAFDRKKLYGQAGMIRTNEKIGTMEYRTLPAQALIQTPEIATIMFTAAQRVGQYVVDVYNNNTQMDAVRIFQESIGQYAELVNGVMPAINNHDVDTCRALQEQSASRLSSTAILDSIHALQSYALPESFDLVGW